MAKVKCTSCNGTGNAYSGFGDAPYKQCAVCEGTGFIGAEDENPFKFTEQERLSIKDMILSYTNACMSGSLDRIRIDELVHNIETKIAEEVDNVS